jgi:hypothetical protein
MTPSYFYIAELPDPPTCDIFIHVPADGMDHRRAIGLIRTVVDCPLPEALAIYNALNPERREGVFGPIATGKPIQAADYLMALLNTPHGGPQVVTNE